MDAQSGSDLEEARSDSRVSSRILRRVGAAALVIALVASSIGLLRRHQRDAQVAEWTQAQAIPAVSIVLPQPGVSAVKLTLPGDLRAWYEAPIYARVNGYLKRWYFDYGAQVKAGQLLAEIDAPDLDAQMAAAQGKLNVTNSAVRVRRAELDFAKTTYERWRDSPKGVVSVQETMAKKGDFESATARLDAALADVNAAQGEVDRLQAHEGFKHIVAPFDGIVTERNTDIGALINAGSGIGGGSGPVLFRVADVHKIRVFVKIPQQMTGGIKAGLLAGLRLPQFPGKVFEAVVVTTSGAIDVNSRTLLVELNADNPDLVLQPGSYAQVQFSLPGNPEMLTLPTSALLFRQEGLEVAVVGDDNKLELKKITIGRNLGTRVEVLAGLAPSDRVVDSPLDSFAAGDLIQVAAEPVGAGEEARLRPQSDKQ
jgi:RND family efflux transporter MFP subunit